MLGLRLFSPCFPRMFHICRLEREVERHLEFVQLTRCGTTVLTLMQLQAQLCCILVLLMCSPSLSVHCLKFSSEYPEALVKFIYIAQDCFLFRVTQGLCLRRVCFKAWKMRGTSVCDV